MTFISPDVHQRQWMGGPTGLDGPASRHLDLDLVDPQRLGPTDRTDSDRGPFVRHDVKLVVLVAIFTPDVKIAAWLTRWDVLTILST